ncbi:aminotransferase class V-fold PLP-dependent enzyme, partial [Streptomyces pratensis]
MRDDSVPPGAGNLSDWHSALRSQFPIITGHPELAYLDSAATAQKPQAVLDA